MYDGHVQGSRKRPHSCFLLPVLGSLRHPQSFFLEMWWEMADQVLENDTRVSQWTLSTFQFNRKWEFSWLARNLTPTPLQKIHWRSVQVWQDIITAVPMPNP